MFRRFFMAAMLFSLLAITIVGTAKVKPQILGPMAYVTVPVNLRDIKLGSYFGKMDLGLGNFTLIGKTEFLVGIARSGDKIYGIDADSNLVRIDPTNAATTLIGSTEVTSPPGPFGLAVDVFSSLSDGRLYLMDYQNNLFSVNASTGKATLVGPTRIPPLTEFLLATSLAGDSNTLYFTVHEVSRGNLTTVTPPTLYTIDPSTARATRVGPTPDFVFGSVFARSALYGFNRVSDGRGGILRQIITLNTTNTTAVSFKNTSIPNRRIPYVLRLRRDFIGEGHGVMSGAEAVQ